MIGSSPDRGAVVGVDAHRRGWIGVVLDDAGRFQRAVTSRSIDDVVAEAGRDVQVAVVAIDIPIGLPDVGARPADLEARKRIGPMASSVFSSPTRPAMEADTWEDALAAQWSAAGKGLTKQTWALRQKILEVDEWLRAGVPERVVEVHPEVSFAEMNGSPLSAPKRSWDGMLKRRALLDAAGIVIPDELGEAGSCGADDVLDAAAAAWTARRVIADAAICLPAPPVTYSDGLPCAIWV